MDDRQTEIRAGAGLEDSRINKEFIDFLNKWSSPVIMVIAIAALVWAGLGKLEQMKIEKVDRAFGELQAATMGGNPSPASLTALAEEYAGVRSVAEIAKLTAVDLYLSAFIQGVQPGALYNPVTGELMDKADRLDEDQRQIYLDQAGTIAQDVIVLTESDEGKVLLTMQGLFRAGAVAECKRDFDDAKANYERAIALAGEAKIPSLAVLGQRRIDALGSYDVDIELPSREDMVPLPGEEIPEIPEAIEDAVDDAVDETGDQAVDPEQEEQSDPEAATEEPQP